MKTTELKGRARRKILWATVAASIVFGTGAYVKAQQESPAPTPAEPGRSISKELGLKITAPFTVAAIGDVIEPQPLLSQEPAYQELVKIIRGADVGFGNMETSLVDIAHFPGPIGGTEAPLQTAETIRALGMTIMNHANNHTFDGGVEGMMSTDAALDKVGIVHAGTGKDLEEARAVSYQETPKGRVGVVGMASVDDVGTYGPNLLRSAASYRVRGAGGAPGLNALRLTDYHIVAPEQLESLRTIRDSTVGRGGGGGRSPNSPGGAPGGDLIFYDDWFRAGPNPGGISYSMNADDEKEILKSIYDGKLYGEFMIATIHAHQTTRSAPPGTGRGGAEGVDHNVPDFLIKFAHEAIDNGADMFITHGVHALHGVEIYKGKPIFYGLASFVFQFGLQYGMRPDPNEAAPRGFEIPASMETVLTTTHFEGGRLKEVRIYPVDLGGTRRPISLMGIPFWAAPDVGMRILQEMQALSKPFGTVMTIENNVGVIRP